MIQNLKPRKADLKAVLELMEGEHETAEDLAVAVLEQAYVTVQERLRWTVVGQLTYSGGWLGEEDARASKVCLGLFPTEGDAKSAADSLFMSASTGEQWRTWVLPVEHARAMDVHAARRRARDLALAVTGPGVSVDVPPGMGDDE